MESSSSVTQPSPNLSVGFTHYLLFANFLLEYRNSQSEPHQTNSQCTVKLPGLIERVKNISWSGFTRVSRGAGLKAYIRKHFCVWSSSHLLFVSQEKGMENEIRQKNQCCCSKILDSKQCAWCLSQFGTISFIKPKKLLRRSVNFSRFIKNNTAPHILFIYL